MTVSNSICRSVSPRPAVQENRQSRDRFPPASNASCEPNTTPKNDTNSKRNPMSFPSFTDGNFLRPGLRRGKPRLCRTVRCLVALVFISLRGRIDPPCDPEGPNFGNSMEMLTIPRKFQILEIRVARWGKIAREASPVQVRLGCDPEFFATRWLLAPTKMLTF